jgi:predicted PurR-regulated permease PerM
MLLFLSILLAITCNPLIESLEKRGIPRWVAFGGIASLILIGFSLFVFILIPQLFDQLSSVPKIATTLRSEYLGKIHNPWLKNQVVAILDHKFFNNEMPDHLVQIGSSVISVLIDIGIVLTFTFYFLLDGKKAYYWAIAFFKDEHREKIHKTAKEFNEVAVKYILGQFIVSALVGTYVFTILTIFKVPLALSLSVIAACLEVLPIFGFLSSLFIIVLVTITVAPAKGIIIFCLFLLYHFIDAYVIIPRVYGNSMRMSGLVVLSSLLIAIKLGGIIAGILVLPLIASYPIIERIWLKKYVGRRTVRDHKKLGEIIKNSPEHDKEHL